MADIVVVDNGSSDDTCSIVEARPDCTLVRSTNTGYAGGVNVGSTNGRAFGLDPRPESGRPPLPRIHRGVGRGPRPTGGRRGSTPSPRTRRPTSPFTASRTDDRTSAGAVADRNAALSESVADDGQYLGARPVEWAVGAVLLVSRACHEALDGWDESYFLYSEETDFAARARRHGFVIWYEPAAVAVHIGAQSGTSDRTHSMQVLNRVRYYARRHRGMSAWCYYGASIVAELSKSRSGTQHRAALRSLVRPASRPDELACGSGRLPV